MTDFAQQLVALEEAGWTDQNQTGDPHENMLKAAFQLYATTGPSGADEETFLAFLARNIGCQSDVELLTESDADILSEDDIDHVLKNSAVARWL